jgi:hypothetical protein
MKDCQNNRMIVIPADHNGIEAQNEIYYAFVSAVHTNTN